MTSDNEPGVLERGIKSFFSFWKDFLVGDSPVLALGVLIILGVAYFLRGSTVLAPLFAIVLVLVLMTFTVWQKTRERRHHALNNAEITDID